AYRWNAAGNEWIPLTDFLGRNESNYTGVLSIAADPNNANNVYLATGLYTQSWAGTGAILASSDKGNTWTTYALSIKLGGNENGRSTGERLQVDPNLGSILFLGSSTDGLWKSTNSGVNWTKVNTFPVNTSPIGSGGISFVLFDKSSTTLGNATPIIYVGVLQTGINLYKSTDGGNNWTAVAGQPNNTLMPHHAIIASNGMMYITYSDGPGPNGITAGAVWKMNTGTGVWTNINPIAGQGGYAGLTVDPTNPNIVMVSTIDRWWPNDEIYRSINGGSSWKGLLNTATGASVNAIWDYSPAPYSSNSNPHWLGDLDIDPFNANSAWFVTGYGVWNSTNINAADANNAVNWVFRNKGLEETVPLDLISPPGTTQLVSAIGDIDGFKHDDITVSPPAGRLAPNYGTNRSIDFAELLPSYMVRTTDNGTPKYGAYSTNGGNTWTAFAASPAGANAAGFVAAAADGGRILWNPGGAGMFYSVNNGTSWTASTGLPAGLEPVADRVNANKFYAYDAQTGQVYVSSNGGATFTAGATGLPTVPGWQLGDANLVAVFGNEGHLWLTNPAGGGGLYRSTNSGANFTKLTNVQAAYLVGFGKAAPAQTYPAIYIQGTIGGVLGFYRSIDAGANWVRINDNQHNFGWINHITGDPDQYGRVYLATAGRGIIYGDDQSVLPLKFLSFSLSQDNNIVTLNWNVVSETNVKKHHVLRSLDPSGSNWDTLASITALNNYSSSDIYTYDDDQSPLSTTVYYKILSEDIDGSVSVSDIISITLNGLGKKESFMITVFPNPSSGMFDLQISGTEEDLYIKIINVMGQVVEEKFSSQGKISFGENLYPGIYFTEVSDGSEAIIIKLIKE
ncbi:MAG: T9SS type A sorting domain-containing protein, partial [Cytophagaceae bacterium]|nr:T9SS type A sorting domain-containing protein [Cytophagaceae bacterium]